jgi:galactose mutarotase-like enzyme
MLFTGYTKSKIIPYFGAVVGRVANRIKKSQFAINGRTVKVSANKGENHLHGGFKGFDKVGNTFVGKQLLIYILFRESGRQASSALR